MPWGNLGVVWTQPPLYKLVGFFLVTLSPLCACLFTCSAEVRAYLTGLLGSAHEVIGT